MKNKKNNKKGFTLAELLIVVAIIAVLVAIAIPIFTSQLEKSRDAVSISNIRAAYAEASAAYLTSNGNDVEEEGGKVTIDADAKTATVTGVAFKGTQSGWSGLDSELDGFTHTSMTDALGGTPGTYTLVFTFTDAGACTLSSIS